MNPSGRHAGDYRNAQHDGAAVNERVANERPGPSALQRALHAALDRDASNPATPTPKSVATALQALIDQRLDDLPLPAAGATAERWRALIAVASHDLSLAKLYEGHTDAIAVLSELGHRALAVDRSCWGMWASEPPDAIVRIQAGRAGQVVLNGRKAWCSGAGSSSHGLMTTWRDSGSGPQLVAVEMDQPGIELIDSGWVAVGMAASASVVLKFTDAVGRPVGSEGDYLRRPGFWQGGSGVAACWHGGALRIGRTLREAVTAARGASQPFRLAALGKVDLALQQSAGLLRDAAAWIDAHPSADASAVALRTRLGVEAAARTVLDEAGRALGAAPFCLDPRFARMAADLPVYVRQSHAERDFVALGERCAGAPPAWLP